jgi:hypothetical protein
VKDYDAIRVNSETAIVDLYDRFPDIGHEIDAEIENHQFFKKKAH